MKTSIQKNSLINKMLFLGACLFCISTLVNAQTKATAEWVIPDVTITITATEAGADANGTVFRLLGAVKDSDDKALDNETPVRVKQNGTNPDVYNVYALAGSATHGDVKDAINVLSDFSAEVTNGSSNVIDLPFISLTTINGTYSGTHTFQVEGGSRELEITGSEEASVWFDAGAIVTSTSWNSGDKKLTVNYVAEETTLNQLRDLINDEDTSPVNLNVALIMEDGDKVPIVLQTTLDGGKECTVITYRSKADGDWNNNATWQQATVENPDESDWHDATSYPGDPAIGVICDPFWVVVRENHTITIDGYEIATIDNVEIENDGKIIVEKNANSKLTINEKLKMNKDARVEVK